LRQRVKLKRAKEDITKKIKSIKKQELLIISDTHFFHKNILIHVPIRNKFWSKGYLSHEEWLIDLWNKTVKDTDIVLHLGDFSFKDRLDRE